MHELRKYQWMLVTLHHGEHGGGHGTPCPSVFWNRERGDRSMPASDSQRAAPVSQFENLETFISTFERVVAQFQANPAVDTIDARKLAELLRAGLLSPVYHGQNSTAAVKHLGRSYAALTEDTTRVMGRLKALYRSQAIACAGQKPYGTRHRDEWLAKLSDSGLQRRAQRLYQGYEREGKAAYGYDFLFHRSPVPRSQCCERFRRCRPRVSPAL